jgi:hypothetical protein
MTGKIITKREDREDILGKKNGKKQEEDESGDNRQKSNLRFYRLTP